MSLLPVPLLGPCWPWACFPLHWAPNPPCLPFVDLQSSGGWVKVRRAGLYVVEPHGIILEAIFQEAALNSGYLENGAISRIEPCGPTTKLLALRW